MNSAKRKLEYDITVIDEVEKKKKKKKRKEEDFENVFILDSALDESDDSSDDVDEEDDIKELRKLDAEMVS